MSVTKSHTNPAQYAESEPVIHGTNAAGLDISTPEIFFNNVPVIDLRSFCDIPGHVHLQNTHDAQPFQAGTYPLKFCPKHQAVLQAAMSWVILAEYADEPWPNPTNSAFMAPYNIDKGAQKALEGFPLACGDSRQPPVYERSSGSLAGPVSSAELPCRMVTATPAIIEHEVPQKFARIRKKNGESSNLFMCERPNCRGKSFGRQYELKRHHNGAHADRPTVLWCNLVGCERSEAEGSRPFPRKDKRNDHVRKVHGMQRVKFCKKH